ncbi:MAG: hypothetical protein LBB59_02715 [Campylobacteraceae bacterium]|jgi:hypothetical protein|nr:hypothetical protein [Campylobacteraceae bacterium]
MRKSIFRYCEPLQTARQSRIYNNKNGVFAGESQTRFPAALGFHSFFVNIAAIAA